jgi:F-type H+-transporting ATPase subunit a
MSKRLIKNMQVICLLLFMLIQPSFAEETTHEAAGEAKEEKFDPGKFIFGHIRDGYSWHVTEAFGHDLAIPLPVIVKGHDGAWHVFMSSKFEHGHASYEGFKLSTEKEHIDKVVEVIDGKEVRPFDLSITKNVFSLLIVGTLLCVIFLSISKVYKKEPMKAPGGFRGAMEVLILFIVDEVIKPCIGKGYEKFVPYLLTVFFFILFNNVLGLIPVFPGGANVTGNIAITMVLAACTFVVVNVFATKDYWLEIFWSPDVPLWLKAPIPLIPFLEFIGIFTKPVALMVRLFANILAGHIITLVFISLIFVFGSVSHVAGTGVGIFSIAFAVVMNILEVLVVFIQAYVFTLLSAAFIGLAKVEPHHAAKAQH